MEAVYDHIQEETLSPDAAAPKEADGNLGQDLQDTYRSIAASPWGARIGGFLGTVRKQGESYIAEARNEATTAGGEAWRGLSDLRTSLVGHARSLSSGAAEVLTPTGDDDGTELRGRQPNPVDKDKTPTGETNSAMETGSTAETSSKAETSSATGADADGFISRFRAEAEKRLKVIQKAEDAADEALLRFGTNIRNFLRDAVTVAPPEEGAQGQAAGVLFESKDAEGRKVIHTSRFDAQLHVIHCALDSFTHDPASSEWPAWKEGFHAETKTDAIAADLKKHDELRRAMEKLVPEKVDYETFWSRYYFLRMVIESEEQRRKEMLKGAALSADEQVAWDEDSDSDDNARATPQPASSTAHLALPDTKESRKSQEGSTAGSDASYDVVSGATSRATGSPKEDAKARLDKVDENKKGADSDDEDWE